MPTRRQFFFDLALAATVFGRPGRASPRSRNPGENTLGSGAGKEAVGHGALYRSPRIYFGVDYYPEAWEESRWGVDARMMREAGFNIARMAEFAWARIEPLEGRLEFDWLDRAVDLLAKNGIETLMGTPTSQPPPWLYQKFPDLYPVNAEGARYGFGGRYVYCFNHPAINEHTRKIVSAIGRHYSDHPAVVGWQIDNEFGHVARECYCKEYCQPAFQEWLRARYGSLTKLNAAWGTDFWSQIYSDWSQVPLPRLTQQQHNPGLLLDYRRFWSDSIIRYQRLQVDLLAEVAPRQFTTHNLWGKADLFAEARDLNLAGMNFYPAYGWGRIENNALELDTFRGLKDGNFWVVEQRGGRPGSHNETLESAPGLLRLWAYQSYAHGADAVLFFRWRTAARGGEEYWHGILGHDGRPNRRYRELAGMGQEVERLAPLLKGTTIASPVAFYLDYECQWAKTAPDVRQFDDRQADYYTAFKRRGLNIDLTTRGRELSRYRIVFAPMLYMVNPEMVDQLARFVRGGGALVLTFRSGVKEWDNSVTMLPLPGLLRDLAGIEIEEYEPLLKTDPELRDGAIPLKGVAEPFLGQPSLGTIWADVVEPRGAQALARYAGKYYSGKAAVTLHRLGDGRVVYLGTHLARDFTDQLIGWLLDQTRVVAPFNLPDSIDFSVRERAGEKLLFLMNFDSSSQNVKLPRRYRDVLADREISGQAAIRPRDLLILREW